MKKENITIESCQKIFNEFLKKTVDLKEKIEKEINEIDKLYDQIFNEVTKSFEIKHEKLKKEEKDLKEELQIEVTKVKEKLEIFLSESNRIIKLDEKIEKGIKVLEKEEKNMIKTLSYVSKMNINQKETKILLQELMKNMKITFEEEDTKIKYEEYYFNGIQIPKNIKFKDIGTNNFKLLWEIDDINIINIDKNEIKFHVELRKENNNEKFIQIYEGNKPEYLVENLTKNTNYEIRICAVYNDLIGSWSQIQKIKTDDFNSDILKKESHYEKKFLEKIYEWCGCKRLELLYRGTRDGTTSKVFHEKCDNKGPTLCLYKNEKGYIFGGYASISWTSDGSTHEARDSFIFTLTNIYGTEPTKFENNDSNSVNHHSGRGPCFGNYNDIQVYADFLNSNCQTNFPYDLYFE